MKRCALCGEQKPLDGFYADRRSDDGRMWRCKACVKAKQKTYNVDIERRRERDRAWNKANPAKAIAKAKRWQERNRDAYLEAKRRYREANDEAVKAAWREYYQANREALLEKRRAWATENPDKKRDARDPAKMRQDRERRRARLLAAFVEDVPFDYILQRDLGHCGICCQPITDNAIDIDHIVPLAAGGRHERNNLQLAHRACNRRKHARVLSTLWDAA